MEQQDTTNISLIDNTVPPELQQQDPDLFRRTSTTLSRSSSTRRWSRPSVRGELQKRKYAKWQPHKLGITDDAPGGNGNNGNGNGSGNGSGQDSRRMSLVDARRWSTTDGLSTGESGPSSPSMNASVDATDFGSDGIDNIITNGTNANGNANRQQPNGPDSTKPTSELDILYENQRGWFLFGIPLYSHSSLLNFDPSAWVTRDLKDSPVNITNAQLPDPSWEWAWQTWYVDMSSDVDEQGWQYSFSFSSSAWHGSHPWFHSFVRRRRWVRLRVKRASMERYRGRTGFEEAHMLTADYFTIHSGRRKRVSSVADMSRVPSTYTSGQGLMDEVPPLEEIGNIPTLMYALKSAIVDREKIDALKRFIDDGGDEIYYLDEKVPPSPVPLRSLYINWLDPRNNVRLCLPNLPLAIPHPPPNNHNRSLTTHPPKNRQTSHRTPTQTRKPRQSRRSHPQQHHRSRARRGPPSYARFNPDIEVEGGQSAVEEE